MSSSDDKAAGEEADPGFESLTLDDFGLLRRYATFFSHRGSIEAVHWAKTVKTIMSTLDAIDRNWASIVIESGLLKRSDCDWERLHKAVFPALDVHSLVSQLTNLINSIDDTSTDKDK